MVGMARCKTEAKWCCRKDDPCGKGPAIDFIPPRVRAARPDTTSRLALPSDQFDETAERGL
jgi:hypothetical protein